MNLKHLSAMGALAVAIPVLVNGCSAADALCCTDYKVGADMTNVDFGVDASIKGQFAVVANVSGDLSAAASDMLAEVGNACRNIAVDLGATADEQAAITAKPARDQVGGWCDLAVGKMSAAGSANIKVTIQPVKCEASFSAQASCSGGCSVDASCDVKAKPPTCEGGKLEVSCEGGCEAEVKGASISCTGSCSGKCEGTCTASGGVECKGQCDGKCSASAQGNGDGQQADGSCAGKCEGTCKGNTLKVECKGQCQGSCDAKCEASPGSAKVKCDGKCAGKFEPLSCKGGELKAQCKADAKCEANCKASAQAKASCEPPSIAIVATGSTNVDALIATLKLNLPKLVAAVKGKGEIIANGTAEFAGSVTGSLDPGKLGVKGSACLVAIASTVGEAALNAKAGLEGGVKITSAIGN
ncbi:MAG: hypothetical protein U0174_00040 [Polyangiaceae bacterium]